MGDSEKNHANMKRKEKKISAWAAERGQGPTNDLGGLDLLLCRVLFNGRSHKPFS